MDPSEPIILRNVEGNGLPGRIDEIHLGIINGSSLPLSVSKKVSPFYFDLTF